MYSSTCFGRPHSQHQELNNCSSSLWFYRWSVVISVLLVVVGPARPRPAALLNETWGEVPQLRGRKFVSETSYQYRLVVVVVLAPVQLVNLTTYLFLCHVLARKIPLFASARMFLQITLSLLSDGFLNLSLWISLCTITNDKRYRKWNLNLCSCTFFGYV